MISVVIWACVQLSPQIQLPAKSASWADHRLFIRKQVERGLTWQTWVAYEQAISKDPSNITLRQAFTIVFITYSDLNVGAFREEARSYIKSADLGEESCGMIAYRVGTDPSSAVVFLQGFSRRLVNLPASELKKKFRADDFVNINKNYKNLSRKEYIELVNKARKIADEKFPKDPYTLFSQRNRIDFKTPAGLKKSDLKLQECWDNGGKTLMPELILSIRADAANALGDKPNQQKYLEQLKQLIQSMPNSDASISWKRRLQREKKW